MRHRRTRDIIIDLTSLLDVIMILIFSVMIQNAKLVEANNQKITEVEAENASMEEKLKEMSGISEELATALGKLDEGDLDSLLEQLHSAENKLDTYEYMDDIIVVFNVGLENRYNNTIRSLTYGIGSDESTKNFNVKRTSKEDWDSAMNSLKLAVNEFVKNEMTQNSKDKYVYIVFSVDPMKVYSSDFKDIDDVLKGVEMKYGMEEVRYQLNYISKE